MIHLKEHLFNTDVIVYRDMLFLSFLINEREKYVRLCCGYSMLDLMSLF